MKRSLNSDELGTVGETRFEDHCKTSNLIPNKSDRDRTGWDFIIEWPTKPSRSSTLDKRPIPISCNVQVKTIWVENEVVKVRLSSVERLAKDPRPCFIYILRLGNDKRSKDAFIVHVRDKFSALILKNLRKAEASSVAPNQKFFSFSLSKWSEKIEIMDNSFRLYAEDSINVTMASYSQEKDLELKKLGFENGGLSLTATFTAKTRDELFDGFLGLTPLQGRMHDAREERFGIALPNPEIPDVEGTIEIQPQPSDTCRILVRGQSDQIPIVFDSQMYTLPSNISTTGLFRAALRTELFDLVLRADMNVEPLDFKITFRVNGDALGKLKFEAEIWQKFYDFMFAMEGGELLLELHPSKSPAPISGKIQTDISSGNAAQAQHLAKLSKIAFETLELAGDSKRTFNIHELINISEDLENLQALRLQPSSLSQFSFRVALDENQAFRDVDPEPIPILYFMLVPFDDWSFVCCAIFNVTANIEDESVEWIGNTPEFRSVRVVANDENEVDQYIERMQYETGVKSYFVNKDDLIPKVSSD